MAESLTPKVEFALGSEVSPGHFFKSDFARSFVTGANPRDSKSLDYEFYDAEDNQVNATGVSDSHNNFYSLVTFGGDLAAANSAVWNNSSSSNGPQQQPPPPPPPTKQQRPTSKATSSIISSSRNGSAATCSSSSELDKLRKKCQSLVEENERLRNSSPQQPAPLPGATHVQSIDSVYLQNQVDTLQWQLKQSEANRQMYRSLMEQVVRFLDRARKSLDIITEKTTPKSRYNSSILLEKSRVPRSRSVHAVHANDDDHSGSPVRLSCASSTTSSSSSSSTSSSSSRFARAKSVAQISANSSSLSTSSRDITWSMHRRNDILGVPRKPPPPPPTVAMSKSVMDVTKDYRRPKQSELDPDDVPPEKLSQEAFRLMRTVQSLLVMREPDLTRLSSSGEINGVDLSLALPINSFANSTSLNQDTMCSSSDRGSTDDEANRTMVFTSEPKLSTEIPSKTSSSTTLLNQPGARQSIDASSVNSGSSKEEDTTPRSIVTPLSSAPNRTRMKKMHERKEMHLKSLRDWALGSTTTPTISTRTKPAPSVSSAEDESGFSSMSSFQEVGLPIPCTSSPIKSGCHTEVGLPEIPIDKIQHRRWSSTPSEFQAMSKRRHSGSFASNNSQTESLSVWV